MNSNIKLIALDLDDTTLSRDGTLSENNLVALKRAIDGGIEIVVASGRNYTSLPSCITDIHGINYAIVSNGAAIYDIRSGSRLGGYSLSRNTIETILSIASRFNGELCFEVVIDGTAYCERRYVEDPLKYNPSGSSQHIIDYIKRTRTPVDDILRLISEHDYMDCVNIVCRNGDICGELHRLLADSVPGIYLTSSVPHLLEVSHADAGKGSGLKSISKMLNIPLSQTAACGNADNDADMLAAAGIGVAVDNASKKCKASANIITGASWDDGVGKFITGLLR